MCAVTCEHDGPRTDPTGRVWIHLQLCLFFDSNRERIVLQARGRHCVGPVLQREEEPGARSPGRWCVDSTGSGQPARGRSSGAAHPMDRRVVCARRHEDRLPVRALVALSPPRAAAVDKLSSKQAPDQGGGGEALPALDRARMARNAPQGRDGVRQSTRGVVAM